MSYPAALNDVARCVRILRLVDDYHDNPTANTRTALRVALMDELATQPQAPQGAVTDAEVESAKLLLGNFNPNGNGRTVRVMLESFLRVRGAAPETPEGKK